MYYLIPWPCGRGKKTRKQQDEERCKCSADCQQVLVAVAGTSAPLTYSACMSQSPQFKGGLQLIRRVLLGGLFTYFPSWRLEGRGFSLGFPHDLSAFRSFDVKPETPRHARFPSRWLVTLLRGHEDCRGAARGCGARCHAGPHIFCTKQSCCSQHPRCETTASSLPRITFANLHHTYIHTSRAHDRRACIGTEYRILAL
jgi:hypothetical protein